MAFLKMFSESAKELRSLRCLTVTAMMIALDIALKSVTIPLGEDIKISFAFIALATIGMLYGPTVSLIAGIVTDLLGFLIFPTGGGGFNPLFTIVEATGALIYGMFLYNLVFTKVDLKNFKSNSKKAVMQVMRIIFAKVTVVVVCNLIMTPMANVLAGYWTWETAMVKFPARLIKNCIQCPVDCVLLIVMLFPILLAYKSIFRDKIRSGVEASEIRAVQNEKSNEDETAKI